MKTPFERASVDAAPDASASFQGFDIGSLLGYRLLRLSTSLGNLADRDANLVAGLSLPEYRVLVVMHTKGPSGVVSLQEALLIDKAWISRTLSGLAEKKLVASKPDPADARRTIFSLTSKGKRSAEALIQRAIERQRRLLHGLTPEETHQLSHMLARIQANVDSSDA